MDKDKLIKLLDQWLEVLNYWDSDIAECAERGNSMLYYHKYERVEDQMYKLWKKLKG